MANKNTLRAKRGCPKEGIPPVTNQIEITIGTGAGRGFGVRNYEEIFKGKACDTSRRNGKKKWVGALKANRNSD